MEPVPLNSPSNPLLKEFVKLQTSRRLRQKAGKIALEGPNLVDEALSAGLEAEAVFFNDEYYTYESKFITSRLSAGAGLYVMPINLFKKISDTETPQPVAAIFKFERPGYGGILDPVPGLAVLLDRIQDPGNMGTMIRTAAAVGTDTVYYTSGSTDPYGPKVLRATAGAVFHLRLEQVADPFQLIFDLQQKGVQVAAAAAGAEKLYWQADFKPPSVLVVGNEAGGVAEELLSRVDLSVAIPLRGPVESLNAAVASAVILYEIVRQRSV